MSRFERALPRETLDPGGLTDFHFQGDVMYLPTVDSDYYVKCPNIFTSDECQRLIQMMEVSGVQQIARVWCEQDGCYVVDPERRKLVTANIPRDERSAWAFDRLDGWFRHAAEHFKIDITGTVEEIKIMKYTPGCHFNTWHQDIGSHAPLRKISISVELSKPQDFEGGMLEIYPFAIRDTLRSAQGSGVMFPSHKYHRVVPVCRGVRYSLVNWTS